MPKNTTKDTNKKMNRNKSFVTTLAQLKKQSDSILIQSAQKASQQHRTLMLTVIAHLAEVARRDLFGQLGFSSLNSFALEELRLGSSSTAHRYCDVARLTVEFPEVLDMIETGELTMETAGEVRKSFRESQRQQPSAAQTLRSKSQRQTEIPFTEHHQEPSASSEPMSHEEKRKILYSVKNMTREEAQRKLGESLGSADTASRPQSYIKALGGKWNYLSIALSDEELEVFAKLRALLSHKTASGNIADTQLRLMMEMLDKHDPVEIQKRAEQRRARKLAQSQEDSDSAQSSNKPNNAKEIERTPKHSAKDQNPSKKVSQPGQNLRENSQKLKAQSELRCQFISPKTGRQCERRDKLDVDHIIPKSKGGGNELDNLQIFCSHHNRTTKRDKIATPSPEQTSMLERDSSQTPSPAI